MKSRNPLKSPIRLRVAERSVLCEVVSVAEEAKSHWIIWVVGYEIVTLFAVHVCSDSLEWCVKASFGVLLFAGILSR
jgi:hypothetical protein